MPDAVERATLEHDGFAVLRNLIPAPLIARFELEISAFAEAEVERLGLSPEGEPFAALFRRGGAYTDRIYVMMERLQVLQEMCTAVVDRLAAAGFAERLAMAAPLVWPDIRADLAGDGERQLPVHQDFAAAKCANALRVWAALRPSDAERGSIALYPGTHAHGPVAHDHSDPLKPCIPASLLDGREPVIFEAAAGDGLLLDPCVFHASVANRSPVTKFTLMVQIQDLATIVDPEDMDHPMRIFEETSAARARARASARG